MNSWLCYAVRNEYKYRKKVADKEFEIPKDLAVKPMKDMQNGNRQGFKNKKERLLWIKLII